MTLETLQDILQWATLINVILIIYWAVMIMAAGDFVYKFHGRLFPMDRERFIAIHYTGLMFFKLVIIAFNLAPLLAIYIIQ